MIRRIEDGERHGGVRCLMERSTQEVGPLYLVMSYPLF